MKSNIWIKYQECKFIVKETSNNEEKGYIDITTFEESDEEEIRKVLNLKEDDEIVYASFVMKRYEFDFEKLSFYIDCVYYDDLGKYALYGSIRTKVLEFEQMKEFIKRYDSPLPIKSKIIHYISLSKIPNLPPTSKNDLVEPKLISYDPFYFNNIN